MQSLVARLWPKTYCQNLMGWFSFPLRWWSWLRFQPFNFRSVVIPEQISSGRCQPHSHRYCTCLRPYFIFSYGPTGFVEGDLFFRDVLHLGQLEQPNGRPFFKRFSKGNRQPKNHFALGLWFFVDYPDSSFPEDVYVFPLSNPQPLT